MVIDGYKCAEDISSVRCTEEFRDRGLERLLENSRDAKEFLFASKSDLTYCSE